MTQPETTQVVIIGAGLSGLSAAKLLTDRGVDVRVLEARGRVGGRTHTVKDPEYGWVDLGGSYVGATQNYILRLARELGMKLYSVYDGQRSIHLSKDRRDVYETQWPRFSWRNALAAQEVNHIMDMMDTMMLEIPLDRPWDAPKANDWDNMTLLEFFDDHCKTREAQEFMKANCQSNVSSDPSQISLLWYLLYLRSTGGTTKIWNVANGGQEKKFEGGTMQMSEKMTFRLKGKVKLNEPVCSIEQMDGKVRVQTLNGPIYEGKYVILAIPLPLLQKIHYNPPLPPMKTQLIQRVTMGSTIKCEIYYRTPFWRDLGYNGFVTSGDGLHVVCNSIDDCNPGSKYGQITCFVTTDKALEMQVLSREQRCQYVAKFLAKAFNTEEALHPVHYIDKNWTCEQYTGGCYTCSYPPGVLSKYGRCLRESFGRIFFAGTETATEWAGYMNGAVQAGERAAREAMHGLGMISKQDIWVKEPEQALDTTDRVYTPGVTSTYIGEHPPQLFCKL